MEEKEIKWLAGFIECDLCGSIYLCCYHKDTEKIECKVCENMANYEQKTVEEWQNAPAQKKIN